MFEKLLYQLKRVREAPLLWIFYIPLTLVFFLSLVHVPFPLSLISVALLSLSGLAVFWKASRVTTERQASRFEDFGFRSILGNLEDALVAYDNEFTVLFFNAAAEELFSIRGQDIIGQHLGPQDAKRNDRRLLAQVVFPSLAPLLVSRSEAGAYPQVIDLTFTDPPRELRVFMSPIANDGGDVFGFVKIIRDRTREITLLKSKNEFVTVASHQIRGPITNIKWGITALGQDAGMSAESKELIKNTLAAVAELSKINEDLLNIAKIEEGRFGYAFEQVDLAGFISELLAGILPRAKQAGVKLYLERPKEALPHVIADPHKLSMVLYNLIENAVRYNTKDGEVVVKIEKQIGAPFVRVSIKDTGIGIPEKDMPKLFTKFFRAENALKAQTEGSGLGLYIAQNIVRAHGGTMSVESQLGRGSTISFTLSANAQLVPQKEVPLEF